jgi:hypothetical protein
MTTHEIVPPLHRTGWGVRVARDGGVVRVIWQGNMAAPDMATFGRSWPISWTAKAT